MRVIITSIISKKDLGAIVAVRIDDIADPCAMVELLCKLLCKTQRLVRRSEESWDVDGKFQTDAMGRTARSISRRSAAPGGKLIREFIALTSPALAQNARNDYGVAMGKASERP